MSPSFPESPLTGGEVLTSHPTTPSEPSSLSNFRQSVTSIQAGLLAPPKNYNARLVQTRAYDICKSIIKEESRIETIIGKTKFSMKGYETSNGRLPAFSNCSPILINGLPA